MFLMIVVLISIVVAVLPTAHSVALSSSIDESFADAVVQTPCYRNLKHTKEYQGLALEVARKQAGSNPAPNPTTSAPRHNISLPPSFDWGNVSGVNFLTSDVNQHVPADCAGCWAIASTSAMADRIKIARAGRFPEFMLAAQTLLSCVPLGCAGGDPDFAYLYIRQSGIGPATCRGFTATGTGINCTALDRCMNCLPNGTCVAVEDFPTFGIAENGDVLGVEQMKSEIYSRGPIVCAVDATPIYSWGLGPNRTAIFHQGVNHTSMNHVVSVVGWGVENDSQSGSGTNTSYWIIRNSWGAYWGAFGYFRLKLGDNQLGMEGTPCSWAVPTYPRDLDGI